MKVSTSVRLLTVNLDAINKKSLHPPTLLKFDLSKN